MLRKCTRIIVKAILLRLLQQALRSSSVILLNLNYTTVTSVITHLIGLSFFNRLIYCHDFLSQFLSGAEQGNCLLIVKQGSGHDNVLESAPSTEKGNVF